MYVGANFLFTSEDWWALLMQLCCMQNQGLAVPQNSPDTMDVEMRKIMSYGSGDGSGADENAATKKLLQVRLSACVFNHPDGRVLYLCEQQLRGPWTYFSKIPKLPLLCDVQVVAVVVISGFIAGLLGIGGALIFNPFLLQLGVHPQVVASTAVMIILFSSSSISLSFYFSGLLNISYAKARADVVMSTTDYCNPACKRGLQRTNLMRLRS